MINFSLIFTDPKNETKSREISLVPETIGGYFIDNVEEVGKDGAVTKTKRLVIVMKEFDAARSQFAEVTKYKSVPIHRKHSQKPLLEVVEMPQSSQKPYLEVVEIPQHLMYLVREEEFDVVLEQLKTL